jgi:hypothetical protein
VESAETSIRTGDSLRTLRQVSLVFFLLLGSSHILSGLLASENLFLPISSLVNRVLDIPFVMIGLVYGLSHSRLDSNSPHRKSYLILMTIISLLVLGVLLYINIFLPDKSL